MNHNKNLEWFEREIKNMETSYLRAISYNEKLASHKEELTEEQLIEYNNLRARLVKRIDRNYYFINNKLQ